MNGGVLIRTYYHVSDVDNMPSITEKGIIPKDGLIFGFDFIECAAQIALGQLGLKDYALFKFRTHLEPSPDNVAELTAKHHCVFKTEEPVTGIRLVGCYTIAERHKTN